jgi:DNA polymerase-1
MKGLRDLRKKLETNHLIGFDVETTSAHPNPNAPLHHDKVIIAGYGIGFPDGDRTYVPLKHLKGNAPIDEAWELLRDIFLDDRKVVWCHNSKYETMCLRSSGFDIRAQILCSYLAAWLLNMKLPGSAGLKLKPLAHHYLKHKMITWEEVVPRNVRVHEVEVEVVAPYCSDDALQCLKLGEYCVPTLQDWKIWKAFEELECEFVPVLVHINECGFAIDPEKLMELSTEFKAVMDECSSEFLNLTGVKIGSSQAISQRLFYELRWWPIYPKIKTGKKCYKGDSNMPLPSVDTKTRERLLSLVPKGTDAYRALELKHRYAKYQILYSTFTHKLVTLASQFGDGRLRCEFNQAGTATTRLSSSKPNFQNIPSHGLGAVIRDAFVAEPGWKIIISDYSGADLVMMAHLSGDERMIAVFVGNRDLHQETADNLRTDRKTGKVCNLGIIYEMQAKTLAGTLGISVARGQILWDTWHKTYPKVRKYQERMHAFAERHGYVANIIGERRYIPDIKAHGYKKLLAQREASNTPDQGSVSAVIKIAMRNLYRHWKKTGELYDVHTGEGRAKIISQVHDEIIVEARDDFVEQAAADVQYHMENAVKLRAPMRAGPGWGPTWLQAKRDSERREKEEKQQRKREQNVN